MCAILSLISSCDYLWVKINAYYDLHMAKMKWILNKNEREKLKSIEHKFEKMFRQAICHRASDLCEFDELRICDEKLIDYGLCFGMEAGIREGI
jgi:hypothetical protein